MLGGINASNREEEKVDILEKSHIKDFGKSAVPPKKP